MMLIISLFALIGTLWFRLRAPASGTGQASGKGAAE
jgi:hypothetical protein